MCAASTPSAAAEQEHEEETTNLQQLIRCGAILRILNKAFVDKILEICSPLFWLLQRRDTLGCDEEKSL